MPKRAPLYRQHRESQAVEEAVARHGKTPDAILPILQSLQENNGRLTDHDLGATSEALHLPEHRVKGIATFYTMLTTESSSSETAKKTLRICDSPTCMLAGAESLLAEATTKATPVDWHVTRTSCPGLCDRAPAALLDNCPVGPLSIDELSSHGLLSSVNINQPGPSYGDPLPGEVRIAMDRIGRIDPDSIDEALKAGGYQSLQDALRKPPTELVKTIADSGLRGHGGAGFPTGTKWRFVAQAEADQKYVVCNADESEPGTFKDRILMEGDPHLLIEGMVLAGYAVGAIEGIIYIRGEYEMAATRLELAIDQAQSLGRLGDQILGSLFCFHLHVHRGAGAYVCGEETALLESLEGRRGEPRVRPPYPTTCGLHGKPTLVNNVETLCKVPAIVRRGAKWYRSMGTEESPGTKIFLITGHVQRPTAIEVPMGVSLRTLIDEFCGGMRGGESFKMALSGGAAGTIVPEAMLDVPLDFAAHQQGVSLGSGAMLVMNNSVHIVDLLCWLLRFFQAESCGKCTPCREGTEQARAILQQIALGAGRADQLAELSELATMLKLTSLCGLGQSASWPLTSAMQYFKQEIIDDLQS